jgi:glutamyl-tRNA synthetase
MIHLGNARAALFSALCAKKNHGSFILRIEDTDVARSDERYVSSLLADLQWLDIHWQEGPGVEGAFGPYWQSQRQAIYAKYYETLEIKKLIYPCFCTDQELLLARKVQLSRGQAPRYAGTCRKLSKEQIDERLARGVPAAWRFIVPDDITIQFDDLVKGTQQFQSKDIGDFIVRRADSTAPFLFCNAIDDALMQISHVLRGEDHLANTPRQILLLQTLNLPIPQYGHLSLIVGDDGAPLSKRHGSFSLHEMRMQGYLPVAIINYLARLGHYCDSQALLNFPHLAQHFDMTRLSRSSARFDVVQLNFWQKAALQALDTASVAEWLGETILNQVPHTMQTRFIEIIKHNITFPHEGALWAQIFFQDNVEMDEEGRAMIQGAGAPFFVTAERAIDQHGIQLAQVLADMKQQLGVNGKQLFMPLRVALTGKTHGPELVTIAELLGQEKMKQRLREAEKMVVGVVE